jgi:hypothetical protein
MSEATQEFAFDLDLVMQGLDYVPYHMERFEPEWFANPVAGVGDLEQHMIGVPLASRAWSLPLWNLVYHEYQPSNTLVMAITNAGLAGGPLYPRGQGACFRPGVTPEEWEDVQCFAYAAFWVAGQKPMIVPYVHDFDFSPVSWSNGQLQWDDPTGTGRRVLDFIGRMHALYIDPGLQPFLPAAVGRFSSFGEAMRPLQTPETNPTRSNPSYPAFWKTEASLPTSCSGQIASHTSVVLPYIEQALNVHAVVAHYVDHQVPAVLHSVWRHDAGGTGPIIPPPGQPPRIGILLANWTDEPQTWQAELDPALYGIPAGTRYTVREVDALGTQITFVGSATAPASLPITMTLPARNSTINRRAVTVLTVGP